MEQETKEVKVLEVDYIIMDPCLDEPFEIYKTANAWWGSERGGKAKVEALMEAFKKYMKIDQAIVLAGISRAQWSYFHEVYPKIYDVKQRCEQLMNMHAKQTISEAVKTIPLFAWKFLEVREPETFGRRDSTPVTPIGGSMISSLLESFVDKDGNLISKRKTLTVTTDGNTDNSERIS